MIVPLTSARDNYQLTTPQHNRLFIPPESTTTLPTHHFCDSTFAVIPNSTILITKMRFQYSLVLLSLLGLVILAFSVDAARGMKKRKKSGKSRRNKSTPSSLPLDTLLDVPGSGGETPVRPALEPKVKESKINVDLTPSPSRFDGSSPVIPYSSSSSDPASSSSSTSSYALLIEEDENEIALPPTQVIAPRYLLPTSIIGIIHDYFQEGCLQACLLMHK